MYFLIASILSFNLNTVDTIYLDRHGVKSTIFPYEQIAESNGDLINSVFLLNASKNLVFVLPEGTTWVSKTILLPSNCNLAGNKAGSRVAFLKGKNEPDEGFISNLNYNLGNSISDSFISIKNLTISGGESLFARRGIYFNKVSHLIIDQIVVLNTQEEGIRVDVSNKLSRADDILISNCMVKEIKGLSACIMVRSYTDDGQNSTGIISKIKKIKVTNNMLSGGSYGIALFNVDGAEVTGNRCISNFHRGIIASPTCSNIKINKNRVDSAGSTGIHIAYMGKNIEIDSNHVSNTISDQSGKGWEGQGIKAYTGFENINITNNICYNNATDGIALEGGGRGNRFLINGNELLANKRNGIRILSGKLTLTKGGNIENGIIKDNQILNNREQGIFIETDTVPFKVSNVKFENNIIENDNGFKKIKINPSFKIFPD